MLTVDSNILIYANDHRDLLRQRQAIGVLAAAVLRPAFLTQQVLGEFCHVTLRKKLLRAAAIRERVSSWSAFFAIVPTSAAQLVNSTDLAERYRKQFWDMVLVRVAADAGATVLLTEDIGDGETIAGVRILNPFNPANAAALDALLTPSP